MAELTRLAHVRKRFALSKRELAKLLGVNHSVISRAEHGLRMPGIELALGLEVLFGEAPGKLFPSLYRRVEELVAGRAARLDRKIRHRTDLPSRKQRALLEALMERASPNPAGI